VIALAALMMIVSFGLGLVAIWNSDHRWGDTALLFGMSGAIVGFPMIMIYSELD
jgi:hypothetical protein